MKRDLSWDCDAGTQRRGQSARRRCGVHERSLTGLGLIVSTSGLDATHFCGWEGGGGSSKKEWSRSKAGGDELKRVLDGEEEYGVGVGGESDVEGGEGGRERTVVGGEGSASKRQQLGRRKAPFNKRRTPPRHGSSPLPCKNARRIGVCFLPPHHTFHPKLVFNPARDVVRHGRFRIPVPISTRGPPAGPPILFDFYFFSDADISGPCARCQSAFCPLMPSTTINHAGATAFQSASSLATSDVPGGSPHRAATADLRADCWVNGARSVGNNSSEFAHRNHETP